MEEKKKISKKIRKLQHIKSDGHLKIRKNTQQKMEGSFHDLNIFLESARSFYEATEQISVAMYIVYAKEMCFIFFF